MPSTSTTHAAEHLHRHAAVQIDCRLSAERAVASPAPHGMPFASVITHNREPTPNRGRVAYLEKPARGSQRARRPAGKPGLSDRQTEWCNTRTAPILRLNTDSLLGFIYTLDGGAR